MIRADIGQALAIIILLALSGSRSADARLSKGYRSRKLVTEDELYNGQAPTASANVLPGCFLVKLRPRVKNLSKQTGDSADSRPQEIVTSIRRKWVDVQLTQQYNVAFDGFSLRTDDVDKTLMILDEKYEVMSVYPVVLIPPPDAPSSPRIIPSLLSGDYAANSSATSNVGATLASLGLPRLTGADVRVGIIDTGVDLTHPALQGPSGTRVAFRTAFVSDSYSAGGIPETSDNVNDCMGHGTHVAGIIAGSYSSSNFRYSGISPGVTLGAYKVFGCNGSTTSEVILAALERAARDQMQIINLSVGVPGAWGGPVAEAIERLAQNGTLVVASVGNQGESGLFMPSSIANAPSVIAVGSTDSAAVPAVLKLRINTLGDSIYVSTRAAYGNVSVLLGAALRPTAADFCSPLDSASDLTDLVGRVAVVTATGCDAATKANNVANAGGIGVVLYGDDAALGNLVQMPYSWPAINFSVPVLAITLDASMAQSLASGASSLSRALATRSPSARPSASPPGWLDNTGGGGSSWQSGYGKSTRSAADLGLNAFPVEDPWPFEPPAAGKAGHPAPPSLMPPSPAFRGLPSVPSPAVPESPAPNSAPTTVFDSDIGKDRRRRGRRLAQAGAAQMIIAEIVGCSVSSSSSWGPSPDLRIKPTVTAPGGAILGLAPGAVPGSPSLGYFMYRSGTSQAAPFVAGALALMIEAGRVRNQPWSVAQMARAIVTTARPVLDRNASSTSTTTPLRAGGGSVDIASLLNTCIDINPARIELGSNLTFGGSVTVWLDVAMNRALPSGLTLQLSHQPAASISGANLLTVNKTASGPMNNRSAIAFDPIYSPVNAIVTFGTSRLNNISATTIPVAGNVKLKVTFSLPSLPFSARSAGIFFSGYLVLRPANNPDPTSPPHPTLTVPYLGYSSPLSGLPVLVAAGISTNTGSWAWDDNDSSSDGWHTNEMLAPPPPPPSVRSPPPAENEVTMGFDDYSSNPPPDYSMPPSPPRASAVNSAFLFRSLSTGPKLPSLALFLQRQPVAREIQLWRALMFDGQGVKMGLIRILNGVFPRASNAAPLILNWDGYYQDAVTGRDTVVTPGTYYFVVRLSRGSAWSDGPEATSNVDVWTSPRFTLTNR